MTKGKQRKNPRRSNEEDLDIQPTRQLTTPSASRSGNNQARRSWENCKQANHNLPATCSPGPVEEKEVGNIFERAGPTKKQKGSKMAKHDSPSTSGPDLVEEKGPCPVKEKRKRSMSTKCTLPSANSSMPVAEKNLNNILQDECEIHDSEKHQRLEVSVDENLQTSLETVNTAEIIKEENDKHVTSDASQKSLEKDAGRKMNNEESMGGDLTSLVEMKHGISLENTGIDSMKNSVTPEMSPLDVQMMTNSLQAGEDKQSHNKTHLLLENDLMESIKHGDPNTSLQAVNDSPVESASVSCLNKLYSAKKKLKKEKAESAIHEDRVYKDLLMFDPLHEGIMEGNLCNLDKPNVDSQEHDKTSISSQIVEADLARKMYLEASMFVQDSPVDSASIGCLNKVYTSKKKMKKRKAEWADHEDKACRDSSGTDPLQEGLVEESTDEPTTVQIEVEKCNAFEKEKMEVSHTDCKEEASSSPSGFVVKDVTSDLDGHGTLLQVISTCVMDISVAGCSDKELASTREHIIKEINGEVFCNLPRVVPDCDLVEAKLESCSTECQKEDEIIIENGGNGQDKLLGLSLPPVKAPVTCSRRKLLILDLNGLLVDMINFQSNWRRPDTIIGGRLVYKRPFCDGFLKFCFERFNVGIWSSRTRRNMEAVVDFLMRDDKHKILFFWDQSQCTETGFSTVENSSKPLFLKELKKIWDKEVPTLPWEKGDYTPSNTLLLDDSPYKALRNPPYTAIFPRPFRYRDVKNNSLGPGGDLRVYLEGLAKCEDVPQYVQEHPFGQRAITSSNPSWHYYSKIIGVEDSSTPAL
ncbi:hypothetical protein AAC387_Pa03g3188 [Persea americana]